MYLHSSVQKRYSVTAEQFAVFEVMCIDLPDGFLLPISAFAFYQVPFTMRVLLNLLLRSNYHRSSYHAWISYKARCSLNNVLGISNCATG